MVGERIVHDYMVKLHGNDIESKYFIDEAQLRNSKLYFYDSAGRAVLRENKCMIIAENITDVLNGEELRAVIAHELGHKTQSPILNKIIEMNEYFWQKGRFNDPAFAARHQVASDNLTDRCELDADDIAANLFGAQNMASALIKLHVAASADNTLKRAVILNDKELRPEDADRFIQDVESKQPNITLEEVRAKLQRVAGGIEVCGEHDLNLRLPRLHARQAKTL